MVLDLRISGFGGDSDLCTRGWVVDTLEPPGNVTPAALGIFPGTLEAVTEFKAGSTMETGALNAVKPEVVVWVGVPEGERLVVVTPKDGVLTLEGSVTALVMAVLELGVGCAQN